MIELPPKFKQALGNGVRTSLYPLVKIYKGYRIDDIIPDDAESINLSIKETNVSGSAYKPLLLSAPSIKSSADIVNNKYTISSVSLSISNAPFQGKIFSDDVQSLLNAVVQIYYCANGIDSIEDCLLVYTGTIRRFSQSAETIQLQLEDLTEQMLATNIPSTLIPNEPNFKKEDIGKPYPMVYGEVDKSPVISKFSIEAPTEGEHENLTNLIIDKPNQQIEGVWDIPRKDIFKNSYIENSLIKYVLPDDYYIYVFDKDFVPINKKMPSQTNWYPGIENVGWSFDYGEEEPYETQTIFGVELYNENTNISQGHNIQFSAEAFAILSEIEEFNEVGIPTRIYRPFVDAGFFVKNKNQTIDTTYSPVDDENKIYGFDYLENWDPRDELVEGISEGSYNPNDDSPAKDEYAANVASGNQTWFEPKNNNQLTPPEDGSLFHWSYKDTNTDKKFNIDNIQNANNYSGLHLTSQTESIHHEYADSGCFAKFMFDEIGSFDCVTRVFYLIEYFQPQNIRRAVYGDNVFNHYIVPSAIWVNPILERKFITGTEENPNPGNLFDITTIADAAEANGFIPNTFDYQHTVNEKNNNNADIPNGAKCHFVGQQQSKLFNSTDQFKSLQWGASNLQVVDFYAYQHQLRSCIANLHQIYTIQDVLVKDIYNRDYYASVKGRLKEGDSETIRSAPEIMENILESELGYTGEVNIPNDFDLFQDQYKINNDFSLSEQKEAKQVFEGLFKSSLAIPSFNEKGEFKVMPIHQVLDEQINSNTIDNQHILKYSFSLTKLEDVKNQVNVKYKKNYGSGDFDKQTGYIFYDVDGNEYESYEQQSELNYPDDPTKHYSLDYYGLTSEEAKLEVETEYIRDSVSARKLQKRLLNWYANQHLIVKVDLPVSYMNLEVGDYIHFDELLGGKKAFGYDYTRHYNKNGQVAYKYFFITNINKSLSKISIEGIQVHRGEYGYFDGWDEDYADTGGNDGALDFEIEDYEDTTIEEDFYINLGWADINQNEDIPDNNINDNPIAIIDTDIIGEFDYKIWITNNTTTFSFGEGTVIPEITEGENFELTNDYITVTENYNTNSNEETQGGNLQLRSNFSPPQGHRIEGYIELTHPDLNQNATLNFFQDYTTDPYDPILGDVNQDGNINILDLVTVVDHILSGEINLTGQALALADMNQDQTVDILDVVAIMNIILES